MGALAETPRRGNGREVAVVAAGGGVGTAARYALDTALPTANTGVPWTTFGINIVGAFLLAALLAYLTRRGDLGGWRAVRLALGTGVLGGFTTYSAVAVQTLQRLDTAPVVAAGYAVGSAVAGVVAAAWGWHLLTFVFDRGGSR